MSRTSRAVDRTIAYPEPPASRLWHRHGPARQPLTPERQRRNREALALALHTPRPRTAVIRSETR
ncbi:hypothetical protein [Streptomyces aureus]|uniref:hypothetical protein n=1 Tax=Streptomyces aureus TaxID=193461 RepID=UPI0036CA6568